MDVLKKRTTTLKKANMSWNIPLSSIFYHLNGKTPILKVGTRVLLTREEDDEIVAWALVMQKIRLTTTWQNSNFTNTILKFNIRE
jgi:predicted transcriptional regulator